MNIDHLNKCNERSVKRGKLINKCRTENNIDDIINTLQNGEGRYLSDDSLYQECLNEAVLADCVSVVRAIVTIPKSMKIIHWTTFSYVKSKEVAALLVEHKRCYANHIAHLVKAVRQGKSKMDQDLLIGLMVKCCEPKFKIDYDTAFSLFASMLKLKSIKLLDGLLRMLDTLSYTSRWRVEAAAMTKTSKIKKIMDIFKMLLIDTSSLSRKRAMFEVLHSTILPYPTFYNAVMTNIAPLFTLNPWIFLTNVRREWYTQEQVDGESKRIVSPHRKARTEHFLFKLATILYLQRNSGTAMAVTDGDTLTFGASIATQLLTEAASPDWMRDVKSQHDEMIEDLLQQLPKDLVILSLHYFVGQ
jgi:hypothetical protein